MSVLGRLRPVVSARAKASNWLTVCVARTLERAMCCSELRISLGSFSRCAKSACMRNPAKGVLSWCAASAKKRFCVLKEAFSRLSKSLMDDTRGATSCGTNDSSMGLRSSGFRARMRCSSSLRGRMPRTKASHTNKTAKGKMTNCGTITPVMISVAKVERLPMVSAICISTKRRLLSLCASHR